MLRWIAISVALISCDESGSEFESSPTTEAPKPGSAGGFSADLAKSMGKEGGSGTAGSAEVKPDKPEAGSAEVKQPEAGSAEVKPDKPEAGGSAAKPDKPEAGSAVADKPETGSAAKPDKPEAGSAAKPDKPDPLAIKPDTNAPRVLVKPSAEVAAIKLSLSPNWDRDIGEAGTISLVVKVPGTDNTRVFSFRYGYEDAKAPTDRDAYKKWLEDNKILAIKLDRQRGSAWYLEGIDGSGAPSFRIIVNWGGRKLVCGGSLYKDPISNQLGDIRDKTIIQAKEICESVAL